MVDYIKMNYSLDEWQKSKKEPMSDDTNGLRQHKSLISCCYTNPLGRSTVSNKPPHLANGPNQIGPSIIHYNLYHLKNGHNAVDPGVVNNKARHFRNDIKKV
jgi:hypothetical protein